MNDDFDDRDDVEQTEPLHPTDASYPNDEPHQPLGLESGRVYVVPYDVRWPALYEAEARRLTAALARHGVALALEHTGSTAVPGLAAKPIIDILAGRSRDTPRSEIVAAVESAGYSYRGEQGIAGRDFFRRGNPRSYHLHVTEVDSAFWKEHRLFRDYLCRHRERATEYARLKIDLALRFPRDREAYIDGKRNFVLETVRLAQAHDRER